MKLLREAFVKMFKDPEFVDELKKRNWEVDPLGGAELQNLAREVVNQPADVAAALKRIRANNRSR
ncbi:MAG: hypothetical protein ABIP88_00240 [Candidatus Binatia bacterium]